MTRWEISINQPSNSEISDTPNKPSLSEGWSIARLLNWTADFFKAHGAEQPRLDAEILLAEALGCERIELYTRFSEEPTPSQRETFRDWVRRHGAGEPVAYLVGHREFFSLRFQVSPAVLIPRPETEHLVSEAIDIIRQDVFDDDPIWLADVGTGCGNIAIAIAKHGERVRIVAVDVSPPALELAARNAHAHRVSDAIQFAESDLLSNIESPQKFHLIVSNPPYIGLDERDQLDRSVVNFEPAEALFSQGPCGTEVIQRLIDQSAQRLLEGGMLIFEISPMIADDCRRMIEQSPLDLVRIIKDLAGLQRVVVAQLPPAKYSIRYA